MGSPSDVAIAVIHRTIEKRKAEGLAHDTGTIAFVLGTYPSIITRALYKEGFEMGTREARKIMAASIGVTYKGGRPTYARPPWQS